MADNFAVVEIGQEYLDWATKLRLDRRPYRNAAQSYADHSTEDEWFYMTRFTRAEVLECIRAGCCKIYAGYVDGSAPDLRRWLAAPDIERAMRGHDMGHIVIDRVDLDAGIVKMWITAKSR